MEVKRTLTKSEIQKIKKNSATIGSLQSQAFGHKHEWGSGFQRGFAYRTSIKIDTIEKHFFANWESDPPFTSLEALHIVESDSPEARKMLGVRI